MIVRSENEFVTHLISQNMLEVNEVDAVYELQTQKQCGFLQAIRLLFPDKKNQILKEAAEYVNIEYVENLTARNISDETINSISSKIASRYTILPLEIKNNLLRVCISDPFDIHLIDDLRTVISQPHDFMLSEKDAIIEKINSVYGLGASTINTLSEKKPQTDTILQGQNEDIENITGEASIVHFVNQMLLNAQKSRATDIHIEPFENEIKVRYRIDGVLHDIKVPIHLKQFQSSLITRIKILAKLDIAEHRLPQDGRIKISSSEGKLDLRVSIIPTSFGETVNIRLLSATKMLSLNEIGFSEENRKILDKYINKSHGILFVTGPTGSGKTTTLYSCLQRVNNREKKIITIEDPIEYQIDGISQIQVHNKIGLSFSAGLRSILRHDPDVLLVGEVRDSETAEIAIRSSLTGHLVLSTLHTNDAPSAIARLIDMGIEPYLISSSIECVIAQRLVRLLCVNCKRKTHINAREIELLGIDEHYSGIEVYEAVGCEKCSSTGYKNRTAIAELMIVTDEIRELINERANAMVIRNAAIKNGMQTLREDGLLRVREGITSIEELIRVTENE